ncbi:hypothetical protein PX701_11730 [Agromyces sp. H3Y2-19a]|uniref:hypothetical protein n=1 Tax=Agromyces chromiiresistens TaxID=3030835 RepID=UPI0023B89C21|nr:hypothetical protein [Agromyces chromiiresistens]MDF0514293.1 hypothetical protein [Agromyces chromiiresistens]
MKLSQVAHSWRRVLDDWDGTTRFVRVESTDDLGFHASAVDLRGGLFVLAGVNSGGKTRLLRSLADTINKGGSGPATMEWGGSPPSRAIYVDFFELLTRQWMTLSAGVDLDEQIEAAGLTPVREADRRDISFVVGRDYTRVSVAELDNTIAPSPIHGDPAEVGRFFRPEVVPFFAVESGDRQHDSRELSRGELSALTLYWVLRQMEAGTVLLLDEPDVLLSPMSAARALDLVVDRANSSKTPVGIATHSYLGLATAPRSAQVLLRLDTAGRSTLTTPSTLSLWKALRVAAPRQIVFVVEDEMAKHLFSELLGLTSFAYLDLAEIWIGGDAQNVRTAASLPRPTDASIAIWGVLDGNETVRPGSLRAGLKLPGELSPEEGAIKIASDHPELFAANQKSIADALDATTGDNPHDRVTKVAASIGQTAKSFVADAWKLWLLQIDEGRVALSSFRDAIELVTPPSST